MRRLILLSATISAFFFTHCVAFAGTLHDAAKSGDISAVERELERGAIVNGHDADGKTGLHYATEANHLDIVRLMLDRGADPDRFNVGINGDIDAPIHAAAKAGNLEAIRTLASANADLTLSTFYASAPLHMALQNGQKQAAALLRELGAGNFKAPSIQSELAAADLKLGERLTKGSCNKCHALQKDGKPTGGYSSVFGPSLWNIVGRRKASLPNEKYSAAMRRTKGDWSFDNINSFIANPTAYVPGTNKWYLLRNRKLRAAVIAYLRTLSDDPVPLP